MPSKKSKKDGAKESVALLKESTQWFVSLKIPVRESVFKVKEENWDRPKFGERSHEETLQQERCARRAAWDLAKIFTSSRMRTKLPFISYSSKGNAGTHFEKTRGARIRG